MLSECNENHFPILDFFFGIFSNNDGPDIKNDNSNSIDYDEKNKAFPTTPSASAAIEQMWSWIFVSVFVPQSMLSV